MHAPLSSRALAAVVIAALAVVSAPASAAPAGDLDGARDAFRRGDFKDAVPVLSHLLYPTPRLARNEDLVEAHVLLGVCAFETGDRATAIREFEEAAGRLVLLVRRAGPELRPHR